MSNIIVKTVGDMESRIKIILISIISLVILSACIPGNGYNNDERIAGFWIGWWHGFIAWISLIISIFNRDIRVYEIFNKGILYDFGFLFGFGMSHMNMIAAFKKNKSKPILKKGPYGIINILGLRICWEKTEKNKEKDTTETNEEKKDDNSTKIIVKIGPLANLMD